MQATGSISGVDQSPDAQHQHLVDEVLVAYRQWWNALRACAEPVWAQLDLTLSQLKGLILLEIRGSMAIGQVADVLAMGRPSASIVIDQLVQLGLVARAEDTADRRRTLVCLTPEGRALAQRLHQGDEEFMRGWFERLDNADLKAFCTGLSAMTEVIQPFASE